MKKIALLLVVCLTLLGATNHAKADITTGNLSDHKFTLFFGGPSVINGTAGNSYNVDVFLKEDLLAGSDPLFISNAAWGMSSGGFSVNVAGNSIVTGAVGNSGFLLFNFTSNPTNTFVDIAQATFPTQNVLADATNTLKLGTLSGTFVGTGVTTLSLTDDPTTNSLASIASKFFNFDLGPGLNDTTTLPTLAFGTNVTLNSNSIAGVPEPSSLLVLGSVLGATAIARRFRRKVGP